MCSIFTIMLRVNGTGNGMSGRVHPDRKVENIYCDKCKRTTPFQKMLGTKRSYFFWIPLPTQEKDVSYWQCNRCLSFIRFGEVGAKYYIIGGERGGIMRDQTETEKNDHLRHLADAILMSKKD